MTTLIGPKQDWIASGGYYKAELSWRLIFYLGKSHRNSILISAHAITENQKFTNTRVLYVKSVCGLIQEIMDHIIHCTSTSWRTITQYFHLALDAISGFPIKSLWVLQCLHIEKNAYLHNRDPLPVESKVRNASPQLIQAYKDPVKIGWRNIFLDLITFRSNRV